jgi:hypothetical protein
MTLSKKQAKLQKCPAGLPVNEIVRKQRRLASSPPNRLALNIVIRDPQEHPKIGFHFMGIFTRGCPPSLCFTVKLASETRTGK